MSANIGASDKKLRMIIGIALILCAAFFKMYWGLLGIIPIGTALLNWCPAYSLFRVSTYKQ
jgi:hypothetical protein